MNQCNECVGGKFRAFHQSFERLDESHSQELTQTLYRIDVHGQVGRHEVLAELDEQRV